MRMGRVIGFLLSGREGRTLEILFNRSFITLSRKRLTEEEDWESWEKKFIPFEKGVDHLTNAIAVCGQPQQLLQVLQQTLPPPVFQMLLTKLPTISQRIISSQALSEDDVE
uniref:Translocase of outer mitochondrial membrane 20 n=1 Tax=Xiphophorus couchianus TaxID=32473 RepID=A0A3B5M8M1_9TELE